MGTVIITGASAGIGRALTDVLLKKKYRLGLMARRTEHLIPLSRDWSEQIVIQPTDFNSPENSLEDFERLWDSLGQVDCVILNAGVSLPCDQFAWANDRSILQVNVCAFTALAGESMKRFIKQGRGHLVGVSSIAGTRGSGHAPAYGASKAYISNYLQGLRQQVKAMNSKIVVTDIRPGFVDTQMVKSVPYKFWMSSTAKAARQIVDAIQKQKRAAYISRRWRFAALLYSLVPEALLEIIYAKFHQRKS